MKVFFVRLFPLLVFFFCFFVIADVVIAILYFNKLECSKEINRILPIFHTLCHESNRGGFVVVVFFLLLLFLLFYFFILYFYLFVCLFFFVCLFVCLFCFLQTVGLHLSSLLKKETERSFPLTPKNMVSFWCGYLNLLNLRIESCNCKLL